MKNVGDTVNSLVRDSGASLGLEYPYVFAHDLDAYLIWHRDTGLVMWVGEEGVLGQVGYQIAWKKAIELNGRDPYEPDTYSPFDYDSVE